MQKKERRERWYSCSIGGSPIGADCCGFGDEDPIDRNTAMDMVKDIDNDKVELTFLGFDYKIACDIIVAPLQKDTCYRAWKEKNRC